jgi:SAM-dependent methyltransferase
MINALEKIHGAYVHTRRVRVLARELSPLLPDYGRILDVGCGDGLLAALIQTHKPRTIITGIDVLVRDNTHIPVSKFDGRTIPFADASFDAVIFTDVFHHTDDPTLLLREAGRVSRDSIVIKDHIRDGVAAVATLRFMDRTSNRRHNVALPHNYWLKQEWLDAFDTHGFSVRTWKSKLGLYPPPADWFFGRSLHFVAKVAKGTAHQSALAVLFLDDSLCDIGAAFVAWLA